MTAADAMASAPAGTIWGVFWGDHAPPGPPHPKILPPSLVLTLGQGLKFVLGTVGAVTVRGERLDPHHVGGGRGQLGDGDGGALAAQDRVAVLVHLGTWVGERIEVTRMEG